MLIGEAPVMQEVRYLLRQVAPTDASVLVGGPSGSGKEVVARALHAASSRQAASQVAVNCGAIPADLLESELFGHEKGAFTGAHLQHRGRFEEADGGTLFLDEIGDMPLAMQVKLLRVLEDRRISRVGGRGTIGVDARIVAATHRDMDAAITAGTFREDLYYRLAVFPVFLPSLAERSEDIPLLLRHFQQRHPGACRVTFTPEAFDALFAHDWPGNVRELRNMIDRAGILYAGQCIGAEQVTQVLLRRGRPIVPLSTLAPVEVSSLPSPLPVQQPLCLPVAGSVDLAEIVAAIEQQHIIQALEAAGNNVSEAAKLLAMQRTTLIGKMQKYGIDRQIAA